MSTPSDASRQQSLSALQTSASRQHSVSYASDDDPVRSGEDWARSATENPWDPAYLTLDGGGIRGYSSLLILRALMHNIHKWEKKLWDSEGSIPGETLRKETDLLPCHYFDYMYGTSTGGLIATMLGRLRMSVDQCLEIYRQVGQSLFGHARSSIPGRTKYDHEPLEKSVREIVKTHCKHHEDGECDGNDWFPWDYDMGDNEARADFDRHVCQSVCLTAVQNASIDEAYLLRTYPHEYNNVRDYVYIYNEGADRLRIWQVTRATSAAPFYFQPLEAVIDGQNMVFKDGGIRENNPSGAAYNEYVSLYGDGKDPVILLSIGTGVPNESQDAFSTPWPGPFAHSKWLHKLSEKVAVFRNLLIKYTDGEVRHRGMTLTAKGQNTYYKRLNVDKDLGSMPLDEWKTGAWRDPNTGVEDEHRAGGATLSHMEEMTQTYLQRNHEIARDTYAAPKTMIDQAAQKLVRQRRARALLAAKTTNEFVKKRWDTYTGHYLKGVYSPNPDFPILHQLKPPVATA